MTQPVSQRQRQRQRQREQDALAWFFKHSPHLPDLHCEVAELSDLPALLHMALSDFEIILHDYFIISARNTGGLSLFAASSRLVRS
jgi:hypothetical protein